MIKNTVNPRYAFPNDNQSNGMTLLDYFAGQALIGVVQTEKHYSYAYRAEEAYKIAQAMMSIRDKMLEPK